jgi:hypothetical protein
MITARQNRQGSRVCLNLVRSAALGPIRPGAYGFDRRGGKGNIPDPCGVERSKAHPLRARHAVSLRDDATLRSDVPEERMRFAPLTRP